MITPIPKNDFIYVYFNYHKNVLAHCNKFYIFHTPFIRNLSIFPKKFWPVHVMHKFCSIHSEVKRSKGFMLYTMNRNMFYALLLILILRFGNQDLSTRKSDSFEKPNIWQILGGDTT